MNLKLWFATLFWEGHWHFVYFRISSSTLVMKLGWYIRYRQYCNLFRCCACTSFSSISLKGYFYCTDSLPRSMGIVHPHTALRLRNVFSYSQFSETIEGKWLKVDRKYSQYHLDSINPIFAIQWGLVRCLEQRPIVLWPFRRGDRPPRVPSTTSRSLLRAVSRN